MMVMVMVMKASCRWRNAVVSLVVIITLSSSLVRPSTTTSSVMVLKETCDGDGDGDVDGGDGDGDGVAFWLPNTNVTVLPLPCHHGAAAAASESRPSTPPLPLHPHTRALVVLASCETVSRLATSLYGVATGNNSSSNSNNSTDKGSTFPRLLLVPVPPDSYTCGSLRQTSVLSDTASPCHVSLHPLKRIVDLTLSWLVYHSWNALTLLYDTSLDLTSHVTLVRRLLEGSGQVGASVALVEVEEGGAGLGVVVERLLSGWREEGARRLVVVASDTTVATLLSLISGLVLEDDESDCDWLVFTGLHRHRHRHRHRQRHRSVTDNFVPISGHRVYFVNSPLLADQLGRGEQAAGVIEYLARDFTSSSCWEALNASLPPVAVYVKRPDYQARLSPRVTMAAGGPPPPSLVPAYTWSPPALGESQARWSGWWRWKWRRRKKRWWWMSGGWNVGKLKPLPARPHYQLHGAHLIVATIRGDPFVRAIMDDSSNVTSNGTDRGNRPMAREDQHQQESPTPRQQLPAHVTCRQPKAFVGFLVDMVQVLSAEMNFTYTMYEVCDASYGSKVDGRWTGVVGDVIYQRAHIGLANLGANYARSLAVSFPRVSTSYGGAGIILKPPPPSVRDRLMVFLLPFSTSVWSCVLVTVPAAALTITLATCPRQRLRQFLFGRCVAPRRRRPPPPPPPPRSHQRVKGPRGRPSIRVFVTSPGLTVTHLKDDSYSKQQLTTATSPKKKGSEFNETVEVKTQQRNDSGGSAGVETMEQPQSFFSGMWFASTVLMQQGQDVVPRTFSGRIVFGVMWVSSVVLYAAYTSNLVSHFTVTKQSLSVNNLEELARSDYYTFGTRTGSVYIDNLKTSTTEVYEAASRRLESFDKSVFMEDYETAIATTQRGSYAFIADYVVLDYYQKKDCGLVLLKEQLFPSMSSFALPRHSPLLPAFNHYLARMSESGILEKLRQRWWSGQPCPDATTVTAYQSIELWEVVSALLLMALGVLIALVVCCCEYLICPRRHYSLRH